MKKNIQLFKRKALLTLFALFFMGIGVVTAQTQVRGMVVDEYGEPVIGATVQITGTTTGTATDFDGVFTLSAPAGGTLLVSYIGYITQEVPVRENVRVILMPNTELLDELVVIGFGTQRRGNITGAVSVVNMERALGDRPITNVGNALQGQIPGLQVTGVPSPGGGRTFNIRGTTSINGGSPLILIDNVEGSINQINPEDIETVTVLKDAASAAIYGARAAFGVILITTKRAQKNSPMTLRYSNSFAFERANDFLQPANVRDLVAAFNEWNPGGSWAQGTGQSFAQWLELIDQYQANPTAFANAAAANGDWFSERWGMFVPREGAGMGNYFYLRNNNAQNEIFDKYGFTQTHNVSASGGGQSVSYRLSLGYTNTDGPLMTNKDSWERLTVSSFVSADVTSWMNTSLDFRYARSDRSIMENDWGGDSGIFGSRYQDFLPGADSWAFANNLEGPQFLTNAPLNFLLHGDPRTNRTENPRIFSKTTFTPITGLEAVLEYTYDQTMFDSRFYPNTLEMLGSQARSTFNETPRFRREKSNNRYNALNAYATYNYSLKETHNFRLMGGFAQEQRYQDGIWVTREDAINPNLPSITGSEGEIRAEDSYSDYAIRSGFFRFNYNYKERYLLEINGRYDGSSRFPTETRFGFFPSVSAGWHVAREDWMEWAGGWLTEFKLRGSWGELGNQSIGNYLFLPGMSVSSQSNWMFGGRRPLTLNPPPMVRSNFTWERAETLDFGLDVAFLNNRLTGSFGWYQRDTKGMLAAAAELPSVLGASAPMQNVADLRTRGIEVQVNWRDRIGDWGYHIGFNLMDHQSHITKFFNETGNLGSFYVGQKMGEIWGNVFERFYTIDDFEDTWNQANPVWRLKEGVTSIRGNTPRPGDIMWRNLMDDENSVNEITNGNNTLENPGDRTIIGNSTPRFQFGSDLGVNYKGIALSVFLQGVAKRDVWLGGNIIFPLVGTNDNNDSNGAMFTHQVGNFVQVDENFNIINPDAHLPRLYGNPGPMNGSNRRVSDRYLLDASYLRIKNITLSYTLPRSVIAPLTLSNARIFFSGENMFTFSKLPSGVDPERISWGYPLFATYSFGLNITL
jgi:TonB-linked SusC/RagA family outer membrane protein